MLEISIIGVYIDRMDRRTFIRSLAAALTLPATPGLSFKPAMAALPAAGTSSTAASAAAPVTAMATKARFWAIYMYGVQGNCTPATLSTVLGIPETQAGGYLTRLVADGTIRPNAILRKAVTKVVKDTVKSEDGKGVLEKVKEYVGWQWEDEGEEDEVTGDMSDEAESGEYQQSMPEAVAGKTEHKDDELVIASPGIPDDMCGEQEERNEIEDGK